MAMWTLFVLPAQAGVQVERVDCEAGDLEACRAVASRYEWGDGVVADPSEALRRYRVTCEAGLAEACIDQAAMLRDGRGGRRNLSAAAAAFGRACEDDAPQGCVESAEMYFEGWGVPRDRELARAHADAACAAGDSMGCFLVAVDLQGEDAGRSEILAARACDDGVAQACSWLGASLAASRWGMIQPGRAVDILTSGCEGGAWDACANLADVFDLGQWPQLNVKADAERAKTYRNQAIEGWELACERGQPTACLELGALYGAGRGVAQDASHQQELMQRACDAGLGRSCADLAYAKWRGGPGRVADHLGAAQLFAEACRSGQVRECGQVAEMLVGRVLAEGATVADANDLRGLHELVQQRADDGSLQPALDQAALGAMALLEGQLTKALPRMRAAVALAHPDDGPVWEAVLHALAVCLEATGHPEAASAWQQYLDAVRHPTPYAKKGPPLADPSRALARAEAAMK
jgi:hypothetical protein